MKTLILLLTCGAVFAQQQPRVANPTTSPNPKVAVTAETAPRPEAFRDPIRKVKNANGEMVTANLQPLFAWFQHRKGKRPMDVWGRSVVTVIEERPGGVLVLNYTDNHQTFFLRNYPYKVAPKTRIQFFSIDSGFYKYTDSNGNEHTVHAADYGIPVNAAAEKKARSAKKEDATAGTETRKE